ncbi:MAG: hypothetical protein AAFZ91_09585 [Pseudomonadota bacterium]
MSDAANYENALDPERPWITDQRQLPANMNWFSTLFNPMGKSPTLHFTRAWTLLFMLQLMCVVGIPLGLGIVSLTGADTSGASAFTLYLTAIIFIVTTFFSFVIHTRRLNDASKLNIRAFIILVPLIAASVMFFTQVQQKSVEFDELYAERGVYLADPAAWEERQREQRRKAQEEERAEREAFLLPVRLAGVVIDMNVNDDSAANALLSSERAEYLRSPEVWQARQDQARREIHEAREAAKEAAEASGEAQNRGRRGGGGRGGWDQGPTADKELPSQEEFILRPNMGVFQQVIMPISALIMIWSLLWVARVPNFGGKG